MRTTSGRFIIIKSIVHYLHFAFLFLGGNMKNIISWAKEELYIGVMVSVECKNCGKTFSCKQYRFNTFSYRYWAYIFAIIHTMFLHRKELLNKGLIRLIFNFIISIVLDAIFNAIQIICLPIIIVYALAKVVLYVIYELI